MCSRLHYHDKLFGSVQNAVRILLVEDNSFDAKSFELALFDSGIRSDLEVCISASSACTKISMTKERIADIILVDLSLQDGNGFDVLQAIRSNLYHRYVPTLILSGSSRPEDVMLSYAHGANAYLLKPNEFQDLVLLVKQIRTFWVDTVQLP